MLRAVTIARLWPTILSVAETRAGRLPTFLIIGAMKAGTTSLYHYLRDHPQVFMPTFKAPEFFAGRSHWDRGVDWYRKQFAAAPPDAVAVGEASNVYTKFPEYRDVPQRIAAHIPDARLVYVIREPIERIRSHYLHRRNEGREHAPFEVAVFDDPIYLNYSRYALQIEQYLEHFPREQLLIITSESLRDERQETVRGVYDFLGVDRDFRPPSLDREFFRTADKATRSLVPPRLRKALKRYVPASKRAKELESHVTRAIRRFRGRAEDPPKRTQQAGIPDETRERLAELLADDVRRLRGFMPHGFDGWGIG